MLQKVIPIIDHLKIFVNNENALHLLITQLYQQIWSFYKTIEIVPTSMMKTTDNNDNDTIMKVKFLDIDNNNEIIKLDFSCLEDVAQWDKLPFNICIESLHFVNNCFNTLNVSDNKNDDTTVVTNNSNNDENVINTVGFEKFLDAEIVPQIELILNQYQTNLQMEQCSKLLANLFIIAKIY